jgi:hypothetical protein
MGMGMGIWVGAGMVMGMGMEGTVKFYELRKERIHPRCPSSEAIIHADDGG